MNNFLNLYLYSTKLLKITLPDVPEDTTIEKAYMMIKEKWTDSDDDALVNLIITSDDSAQGHISDIGEDGTAVLEFIVSESLLDGIEIKPSKIYYTAVKVILSNGAAYLLPNALIPTKIHPAGIEATE